MARFSVGGDEDGNEDASNSNRSLPKRPRTAAPIVYHAKRSNASSSNSAGRSTVASNSSNLSASLLAAPVEVLRPEEPAPVEEVVEEESEEESDASISDSEEEEEDGFEEEEEEDQQNSRGGDEVQDVDARLNSVANGNGGAAPVSVTLMDPDVLDCPICLEPLSSPVYQCENGHIACASCCHKMRNKCASCCWPIGYNRCRAIEKVLESIRVSCRNKQHGCTASLNYSKKLDHEKTCTYTPCSCPVLGCYYVSSAKSLYAHFTVAHPRCSQLFCFSNTFTVSLRANQKHVFLQDKHEFTLFVLNRSTEAYGSSVNVFCIAPASSNRQFTYNLTARDGVSSIQLKTVAEATPQWAAQPPTKKYVIIPKDFMGSGGELEFELTISCISS